MAIVYLTSQAQKDLKKISVEGQKKIRKKLLILKENPKAGKKLSGKLAGSYSLKAWPYRIVYCLKKSQPWVVHISHRQQAYK